MLCMCLLLLELSAETVALLLNELTCDCYMSVRFSFIYCIHNFIRTTHKTLSAALWEVYSSCYLQEFQGDLRNLAQFLYLPSHRVPCFCPHEQRDWSWRLEEKNLSQDLSSCWTAILWLKRSQS